MNYLVLRPQSPFCVLRVYEDGDAQISQPYKVWALQTGRQILFVNNRMAGLLKGYYLNGTYQNGALYAYSYEDMLAILTDALGPCDEERAELALESANAAGHFFANGRAYFASYFLIESGGLFVRVAWMGLKFLMLLLIIPFIIHMLSKRR